MSRIGDLQQRFQAFSGRSGRVAFAPGRINLVGEHTDYSAGFVLPASLALGTWTVAAPRADRVIRVFSEGQPEIETLPLDVTPRAAKKSWSDYVTGVAWALQQAGCKLRGADLLITSDVPMGSGLSSSAALEVSVAHALLTVAEASLSPLEIARACQRAENDFVGARCGIMDQFAATHGEPGRALLLDCADYSWKSAPLPTTHFFVVANTMVRHALAHGEYNVRRAESEELVDFMLRCMPQRSRLAELTDAEMNELIRELPATLARRLRHVVSENRRVHEAYAALESGNVALLGRLLAASHESLRNDYQVSCRELDLLVEIARDVPGVVGARMIGGGFGGCTLSLVEAEHVENLLDRLRLNYVQSTGKEPATYICEFGGAGGMVG
ncbi:MAG TPA: galactokinase [Steroidobacteraceae bacterium]|jgi:galactokinase|nr:galactokinase [Steroidobacteraceae bacterium]